MKSLQAHIAKNIQALLVSNKAHNAGGTKKPRPASIGMLSKETMLDKSLLAKLLKGSRRMNVEQIEDIAKALGVGPLTLFKP